MEYNVRTTELKSNKLLIARIVSHCVRMKTGMRFTMTVAKLITVLILFINIAESDGLHTEEPVCQRFTADEELKNLIEQRRHNTIPCPCDVQNIQLDHTFRKSNKCYEQWFFIDGVKQMCCYNDNGRLLVGPPDGGYILLEEHEPYISAAHQQCCLSSSRLCEEFYAINPSDNCSLYEPPISVKSGGDVHITTVDGLAYDFNGHGEYVFLKTNEFEIQARTDYVIPGNTQSTMFTAFAFYDMKNHEQIEVHHNRNDDVITVYRNGTVICNTAGITKLCEDPPKHQCSILAGNGIAGLQRCSIGNYFQQIKFSSGEFMDISLAPDSHKPKLSNSSGLAGNARYGFVFRNGTMLQNNSAEPDMFAFGESWALQNGKESHFNYSNSGESFSFYNGNRTTPRFMETLLGNLTELFDGWSNDNITIFNETCRTSWDNEQSDRCLLTIARTGNLSLGKVVMKDIEDEHIRWHILHNNPPEFLSSMPDNITVQNHRIFTFYLPNFVQDVDNDVLSFNVTTSIRKEEINLTADGNFTWMVGTALRYIDTRLVFYVIDNVNASSSHDVKINYCGCEEIEQCNYNALSENSTESVIKATCNCPKYHSGVYCENLIDPCNSTELNCSISCNSSVPQTFASWPCTQCPNGTTDHMRGGTQECLDINECENGINECQHLCNNTNGSYVCSCFPGYTMNSDNHTCNDIDECLNGKTCLKNEVCTNLPGNSTCACAPRYTRIRGICEINEGSTFVGSIQLPIIDKINYSELNKSIDSKENRKKVEEKLQKTFNCTEHPETNLTSYCISVEVVQLIVIIPYRYKRETHEQASLSVKYVVRWSTNESNSDIGGKLQSKIDRIQKEDLELKTDTATITTNISPTNIIPNKDGLCSVADGTDCDHASTECINDENNGATHCRCLPGFKATARSKIYCEDEDECTVFTKENTTSQRCVHGSCINIHGSWNCSCPHDRTWQNVGNKTHQRYRCQGNHSYIGRIDFDWMSNDTHNIQTSIIDAMNQAFLNPSLSDKMQKELLKDLLVSVNILDLNEVSGSISDPPSSMNATFNLRMGETVDMSEILTVLGRLVDDGFDFSIPSLQIKNVTLYTDTENVLCELTDNGKCDPKTTTCQQKNGLTECICKPGFVKGTVNHICIDLNECENKTIKFCSGNGKCINTFGGYTCDCNAGYTIDDSDKANIYCGDLDECNSTSYECSGGHCNNSVGSWSCTCPSGYFMTTDKPNYKVCQNINECTNTSYHCGGDCRDTDGHWNCSCRSGFKMSNNSEFNITCDDIDECNISDPNNNKGLRCAHGTCSNSPGSWNCICPSDRQWQSVGNDTYPRYRCQGNFSYIVELEFVWKGKQTDSIHQSISNTVKSAYENSSDIIDNSTSVPLRELLVSVNVIDLRYENGSETNSSKVTATLNVRMGELVNIAGIFNVINSSFGKSWTFDNRLFGSGRFHVYNDSEHKLCELTNQGKCDLKSTLCQQKNGLTECNCIAGYTKNDFNDRFCSDVDECANKSKTLCSGKGNCSNTDGGYTCACIQGYIIQYNNSDILCKDIDECSADSYKCNNGECDNYDGGWSCTCMGGYIKNEVTKNIIDCDDINECTNSSYHCGGNCANTNGSWICTCGSGFTKTNHSLSNITCDDIDECKMFQRNNQSMCINGVCTNLPGSWNCTCLDDRLWTKMPNGSYRCQGNFSYVGALSLVTNENNETLIGKCTEDYINRLYKNTTVHDTEDMELRLLFVAVNYLNVSKEPLSPGSTINTFTIFYRLRMGEAVSINYLQRVIDASNISKTATCNVVTIIINTNSIYKEDSNVLCNFTNYGGCDPTSTECKQLYGTTQCNCRNGFERYPGQSKFCYDINECEIGGMCSGPGNCSNIIGSYVCSCANGYTLKISNELHSTCEDIDECHNTSYSCGGKCNNTVGGWNCECDAGYIKNSSDDNKRVSCTGGFQYVVSLGFAVAAIGTENIDENNKELTEYFRNQITRAYNTSFPDSVVKVDILAIKRSVRVKRETSGQNNFEVDFVLNINKHVEQKVIESAWSNFTEKCKSSCEVLGVHSPFNISLGNAVLKTDPAPVLCDYYHYCDEETTLCEYVNHTIKCPCKKGYVPKHNTDAKCQVKADVCTKDVVCENGATCKQPESSGSFQCICQKGWTGKYCNIAQTLVSDSDSDQTNTMLIAVGGSLGGVVIILLVTIFVVCRWRGRKVKEAEKIALKNMDNNGSKHFNGSLYDDRYIGDSQHNSLERKSLNSFREPRQNESPIQSGYRISAANLYATPHKLHRQTIHGSMIDLSNRHADPFRDEPRRLSIQDPQRHIASNMGWSYTANMTRPVSLDGDILRKHPHADYDRPPSPQPDYHRNERLDAARNSGMGVGHNRHGSFSNDYRHSDPLRRVPFDGPNGETRF